MDKFFEILDSNTKDNLINNFDELRDNKEINDFFNGLNAKIGRREDYGELVGLMEKVSGNDFSEFKNGIITGQSMLLLKGFLVTPVEESGIEGTVFEYLNREFPVICDFVKDYRKTNSIAGYEETIQKIEKLTKIIFVNMIKSQLNLNYIMENIGENLDKLKNLLGSMQTNS